MTPSQLADIAIKSGMYQHREELEPFIAFVQGRGLTGNICEIGAFTGGGIELFCHMATGLMISIDLPGGPWGGELVQAEERNRRAAEHHPNFTGILGNSRHNATLAAFDAALYGQMLDLLFIDGDHSYAGVQADWELYGGYVRSGGAVAFHDIIDCERHARDGVEVKRLWDQLKTRYEHYEFTDGPGDWGGIGVVILP